MPIDNSQFQLSMDKCNSDAELYPRNYGKKTAAQKTQPICSILCSVETHTILPIEIPRLFSPFFTIILTCSSASRADENMLISAMNPISPLFSGKPAPSAHEIVSPGLQLVRDVYTVGVSDPGSIEGSSTNSANGGIILVTLQDSNFQYPPVEGRYQKH